MCRINEEMCDEARKESKRETSIEIAQKLISMNMPVEDIAKATNLSVEEVQSLAKKIKSE